VRIKDISKENRPRERFQKLGASALSDAELLSIILQKGNKKENVIDMSNRLISKFGLDKLVSCSLKELQEIDGIGPAKAMQIKSLFEFYKRHSNAIKTKNIVTIKHPEDVYNYFVDKLKDKKREYFYALLLDSKNRIIKEELISVGTLNSSLVHPREVFKEAIKNSANAIILVHNHPDSDPKPSENDIEVTRRLAKSADILNIKILDHIIIGKNGWDKIKINYD